MPDLFRPPPILTTARLNALRIAANGPLFRVRNGYRPRGGALIRIETVKPLITAGYLRHGRTDGGWAAAFITPDGRAIVDSKRQRKAA